MPGYTAPWSIWSQFHILVLLLSHQLLSAVWTLPYRWSLPFPQLMQSLLHDTLSFPTKFPVSSTNYPLGLRTKLLMHGLCHSYLPCLLFFSLWFLLYKLFLLSTDSLFPLQMWKVETTPALPFLGNHLGISYYCSHWWMTSKRESTPHSTQSVHVPTYHHHPNFLQCLAF